jgi:predicted nucleic acid-binding protein
MTRVFADTFYFLAVLNRHDPAHETALKFYGDPSFHFITTEWILVEVGDATAAPAAKPNFQKLLEVLDKDGHVKIIPARHELFRRGLTLYFERPDKEWSLTDCISFVAMGDEGLSDALTGDRHFEQAGFAALLRANNL